MKNTGSPADSSRTRRASSSISRTSSATTSSLPPRASSSSRSIGQTVRLRPMTTRPNRLYFIFRDGTSGEGNLRDRALPLRRSASDGTTVLDFNQAYNPPCAFNPFTTCPLPLMENRLKVRIPGRRTGLRRTSLKLYLVHHAEALPHEDDSRRPLSPRGDAQAERGAAEAAARGAKPVVVWHSGKLRARQTAMAYWRACNALAEFSATPDLQPAIRRHGCAIACAVRHATS